MKKQIIREMIERSISAKQKVYDCIEIIEKASEVMITSLQRGNKILICGNGGSAAEAQHFAAELIGRFEKERKSLPCISLTTDSSNLTSIGNDAGFEFVFSRQIESLGIEGDILIILTTSDYDETNKHSLNIKNAVDTAKRKGMSVIGLLSIKSNKIGNTVDISIKVNDTNTARIQECHLLILHIFAKIIEDFSK